MIFGLVRWAVHNRLVVCLLGIALIAVGGFALWNINIEAYPDPAPAIVEVIAQYPGASAEEVERQITTPLEVALAGMQKNVADSFKYTGLEKVFALHKSVAEAVDAPA